MAESILPEGHAEQLQFVRDGSRSIDPSLVAGHLVAACADFRMEELSATLLQEIQQFQFIVGHLLVLLYLEDRQRIDSRPLIRTEGQDTSIAMHHVQELFDQPQTGEELDVAGEYEMRIDSLASDISAHIDGIRQIGLHLVHGPSVLHIGRCQQSAILIHASVGPIEGLLLIERHILGHVLIGEVNVKADKVADQLAARQTVSHVLNSI